MRTNLARKDSSLVKPEAKSTLNFFRASEGSGVLEE